MGAYYLESKKFVCPSCWAKTDEAGQYMGIQEIPSKTTACAICSVILYLTYPAVDIQIWQDKLKHKATLCPACKGAINASGIALGLDPCRCLPESKATITPFGTTAVQVETKEKLYTRAEVDELIRQALKQAVGQVIDAKGMLDVARLYVQQTVELVSKDFSYEKIAAELIERQIKAADGFKGIGAKIDALINDQVRKKVIDCLNVDVRVQVVSPQPGEYRNVISPDEDSIFEEREPTA